MARLRANGRIKIPKAIRRRMRLKRGDRIDVVVERDRIVLLPRKLRIDDICSILPRPVRALAIEEMEAALRAGP